MLNYFDTDTFLNVKFILLEKEYQASFFNISLHQEVDYKGQPQAEVRGGKITLVLRQLPDNIIYDWARKSGKEMDGSVVFYNELGGSKLKVLFTNGFCVHLKTEVDDHNGTQTKLIISSEQISLGNYLLDKNWSR